MQMYNPPHIGDIIKEMYIEPLNLSVTEVAKGLGVSRKTLSELINGHSGISSIMALKLAEAFNTTPEYWLNLQQQYDIWQAKQKIDLSEIRHFIPEDSSHKHAH
ncbi:MAG: addiction module antidote protein, HigA family [Caedibacter sp. 37-49]|nr:MAG: addiction module antidote protein, HigA family [Caedibacter sp. 37-49]